MFYTDELNYKIFFHKLFLFDLNWAVKITPLSWNFQIGSLCQHIIFFKMEEEKLVKLSLFCKGGHIILSRHKFEEQLFKIKKKVITN